MLLAALELDPLATPADAYERATAEAEERLGAAARAELGETPFRLRTIGGVSAPRALHEVAEDEDADVIVLGSTHRGGLGRVLPGSVGERLLHGAPCAVLIAPSGFAGRERLEIRADRRRLRRQDRGEPRPRGRGGLARGARGRAWRRSRSPATGRREPADPDDAAAELVERSRELDLLVVGSRGYGPVRHALLGSVTSELMQAAACPVLVVPRSER